ncbi:MAG: trigger factor [Chloroflexi bacterium]|nr:trigger factor [Chloroflexota bacterium]
MDDKPRTDAPAAPAAGASTVTHTVLRKPGSIAVLDVHVDAGRVERQTDRVFQKRVRQSKIPGFRPGKAPRAIYERTYGADHLWAEAAEDVIDETYREIVQAERIKPVDSPEVELLSGVGPSEALHYTATVAVTPEVTLGTFPAPEIAVKAVTDADVTETIDRIRRQQAVLQPVDREARDGDVVTMDVDVAVDGGESTAFGRNAHVELGKPFGIAGFVEGVVGMKANEERRLELVLPDDYVRAEQRGKPATFTVTVSQVGEQVLPARDDELAKGAGLANLAALERAVRGELAHGAFHAARDEAADRMLAALRESSSLEMPEILVRHEVEHLIAELKDRVRSRGINWEQFLLEARKTEDELRTDYQGTAAKRAKSLLVLDALAEREGVTVTGQELAAEVAQTPVAQQDARALRDPRVLASMARSMRNRKVVDKMLGLDGPEGEKPWLVKFGAPEEADPHEKPELIVPESRPRATAEGRAAIRAMLEEAKKPESAS